MTVARLYRSFQRVSPSGRLSDPSGYVSDHGGRDSPRGRRGVRMGVRRAIRVHVDPRSPPFDQRAGCGDFGWTANHFGCRDAIGDAGFESIGRPSTGIKGIRNSLKQYRIYLSAMQVERAIAKVLVHQNRPGLRTDFKSWRICIEEPV